MVFVPRRSAAAGQDHIHLPRRRVKPIAQGGTVVGHAAQIDRLDGEGEDDLRDTFEKFRQEELEHHDTALDLGAEEAPGYEALKGVIKRGSKLAIWLSERI